MHCCWHHCGCCLTMLLVNYYPRNFYFSSCHCSQHGRCCRFTLCHGGNLPYLCSASCHFHHCLVVVWFCIYPVIIFSLFTAWQHYTDATHGNTLTINHVVKIVLLLLPVACCSRRDITFITTAPWCYAFNSSYIAILMLVAAVAITVAIGNDGGWCCCCCAVAIAVTVNVAVITVAIPLPSQLHLHHCQLIVHAIHKTVCIVPP